MKTDFSRPNRLFASGQRFGILLSALIFILSGCSNVNQPVANPTSAPVAAETSAAVQETPALSDPTPMPATATIDVLAVSDQLQKEIIAQLPPTATPSAGESPETSGGIAEVKIEPLEVPAGSEPLWVAYSLGFPNFEQEQKHFLAIYSYVDQTWKELARQEIVNASFLMEGSVEQIKISQDRIWLFVQSGVGAHSSCVEVLSFDLGKLKSELESCNSSPLAGFVQDNDSDGIDEVVTNDTDNYVFCYACSERFFSYTLHHWDGKQFQQVNLQTPPPVEVSSPLYQLFEIARLGLWTETRPFKRAHETEIGFDSLARMYLYIFELHRDDFEEQAQRGGYPLLDKLFHGDYAAAEALLRAYSPEELFVSPSPLIAETMAEGWEEQVLTWITSTTDRLISVNNGGDAPSLPAPIRDVDRLAAANYLHGWALSLGEGGPSAGQSYFEQAAKLKPDDAFYQATVAYLQNR
jgi:hypothetical protein